MVSIYKSDEGKRIVLEQYDLLLADCAVPYTTRTIPTRHGETWVLTAGNPTVKPLILLHGTGTNSAMWLGDILQLSKEYHVHAVDIIGEPGKSAPNRPDLKGPEHAEWIEDVLDGLQLQKVALIGCSLGGWMSLKFATVHPERVEKLVLLCPSGVAPAKLSFLFHAVPLLFLGEWGIKKVNRLLYGSQPVPDEADAFGTLIMKHFKPRYDPLPLFSDEELQRLAMPTLLIAGEDDVILPSEQTVARLQKLLPNVETNILSGVGHVILNVTNDILGFLSAGA